MGAVLHDGAVVFNSMSNHQLLQGEDLTTLVSDTNFDDNVLHCNICSLQVGPNLHDHYKQTQLIDSEIPLGEGAFDAAANDYQRLPSLSEKSAFSYDNPLPADTINRIVDECQTYGDIDYHSLIADTDTGLSFPGKTNFESMAPDQQPSLVLSDASSPSASNDRFGKHMFTDDIALRQAAEIFRKHCVQLCNQAPLISANCNEDYSSYNNVSSFSSNAALPLSTTSVVPIISIASPNTSLSSAAETCTTPGLSSFTVENQSYHQEYSAKTWRCSLLSSSGQSESFESSYSNPIDNIGIPSNTDIIVEKSRPPATAVVKVSKSKKRKRTASRKNVEELESQRMTHIAVERNRRRQMNQHLNSLRSLMPSSYIQRGDQASIVGGAIRFVEELEQVAQSLRLQKQMRGQPMTYLQHRPNPSLSNELYACSQSSTVSVEVCMASLSSILVKVIVPKRPHQLLHTLHAFNILSLQVLHLNITSLDTTTLYSFNLQMDNYFGVPNALELAKSIQCVFEISEDKNNTL